MAGLRGNQAWWMFKAQSVKGTPAVVEAGESTPAKQKAFKVPFSGGAISPARSFGQLAETDNERDQGVTYAKTGGLSGSPEMYARDDAVGALLTYVLGADAATGTTPNFVHTITPSPAIPYVTFWNSISGTLWERFQDCQLSSLNLKATAGEPLTATASVVGIKSTRLTADPSETPVVIPLENGYVYNFNDATVTYAGSATRLISSFDLTINNNATPQQTDDFSPYDVVTGQRQVELSFDLIFESLAQYNEFNYKNGSGTGTAETNEVYTTSAIFSFDHGANNKIELSLPSIAYETFPISSNTTGAPIVVSVKAVAQRVTAPTKIITAIVKNQVEAY